MEKLLFMVVLQSQLGPRAGELVLQEDESTVTGSVLQSGKYFISGTLRSPVDLEPYDAIFTVREDRLSGGLITPHGCWDLTGVRAAAALSKA